jgi:thiamine-phosphate pyrophosphorylase
MSPELKERMERFAKAGLYLVTSQPLSAGRSTLEIVRCALGSGVRLIQLREKQMSSCAFAQLAEQARKLTAAAGALLIINDRVDIALAVGADGVHLGQDDLPIPMARQLARDLIIGASTHNVEEALRAQQQGASYINIGPIYSTNTKPWGNQFLGLDGLRSISAVTSIPFSVMGGIKLDRIPELVDAGARVFALVSAVTAADNPQLAAIELLKTISTQIGRKHSTEK